MASNFKSLIFVSILGLIFIIVSQVSSTDIILKAQPRSSPQRETPHNLVLLKSPALPSVQTRSLKILLIMVKRDSSVPSTPRETYTAAVVEYHCVPIKQTEPFEYMLANAAEYASLIKEAKNSTVDIIVFPEYGLTDINPFQPQWNGDSFAVEVPTPIDSMNYSDQVFTSSQKVLSVLASAARENSMYVVVNLIEKVNCTGSGNCPSKNFLTYNTNIAFDRNGCIIARYRKFNLFGETSMSIEKESNVCTFKTDFNVVFGMFICFDIMFGDPSLRLIFEKGVTDVIYSTAWLSELPFLSATAVQTGWAQSMDVSLLASGYRNPITASGGSGIYDGKNGAKTVTMPRKNETELLIAKLPIQRKPVVKIKPSPLVKYFSAKDAKFVPKIPVQSDLEKREDVINQELILRRLFLKSDFFGSLTFKRDRRLVNMRSKLLIPADPDHRDWMFSVMTDVRRDFVSSIKVNWRTNAPYDDSSPRYRLFSYEGPRVFGEREGFVSVCAIVACANETIESCGIVPNLKSPVKTSIKSIDIQLTSSIFTMGYLPITLDFNLNQLPSASYSFSKVCNLNGNISECIIDMSLKKPINNLFTFAVYKIPS